MLHRDFIAYLAKQLAVQENDITPEKSIADLGGDSLDVVEMVLDIEDITNLRFNEDAIIEMPTIQDVMNYLSEAISRQTNDSLDDVMAKLRNPNV